MKRIGIGIIGSGGIAQGAHLPAYKALADEAVEVVAVADVRRETGSDVGALRASFGIVSDFSDAWRLSRFVERFLNATSESMGTAPGRTP